MLIVASVPDTDDERAGVEPDRITLTVDDPEAMAARYWNAGYTVLVEERSDAFDTAALSVIDRFGLRIDLRRL